MMFNGCCVCGVVVYRRRCSAGGCGQEQWRAERARATPVAFREQLDGSDKRVPNLNIYERDPFGTSSLNDNIIKTQTVLIMQRTLSEHFLW